MPANRFALIRYKTIDDCLRRTHKKWTIEDLVEACSEKLYEFEGKKQGISLRTIQLDIQNMRSEKLGYNAPIVVTDKKYYTYANRDYSITNMPLTSTDVNTLSQITHTLMQFEGFKQFSDMEEVLKKIENKVFTINSQSRTIIDFEKNNLLKGIKFLDDVYNAIKEKTCLKIVYQAFKSTKPTVYHLSPYLLKEYRNRWYVFGRKKYREKITPLPLDRILKLKTEPEETFIENTDFDPDLYFKDIIGVTSFDGVKMEKIKFWVETSQAPYVITKPFHASQKLIETKKDGSIFSIEVIPNNEMEREFMSFGDFLKILEPAVLRDNFKERIKNMTKLYK